MGLIVLILNILFPGWGTVIAAIVRLTAEKEKMMPTLIVGILQFVLTSFLIGWFWSIWWGFKIYQ
ncbi:predicted protein [Naegleria gruberi]|uniref:Predicted protein n=1 Tax=Naegleria gruberi TaxID=5762 RepID=D2VGL8_NAEGR|nr:uncharacterized protein NAEGRDRAFT_33832 [Naegleria gruberi]EFC43989.1 predicted protein [Naegleria gruberi]|eukprot:XP_002676733.1 predicted protein [Naegleria gruberi strain NEG-M]